MSLWTLGKGEDARLQTQKRVMVLNPKAGGLENQVEALVQISAKAKLPLVWDGLCGPST